MKEYLQGLPEGNISNIEILGIFSIFKLPYNIYVLGTRPSDVNGNLYSKVFISVIADCLCYYDCKLMTITVFY